MLCLLALAACDPKLPDADRGDTGQIDDGTAASEGPGDTSTPTDTAASTDTSATDSAAPADPDWTVGDGGDFSTLQEALDASADGDVIAVSPGTYVECLTFPAWQVSVHAESEAAIVADEACTAAEQALLTVDGSAEGSLSGFELGADHDIAAVTGSLSLTNVTVAGADRVLVSDGGQLFLSGGSFTSNGAGSGAAIKAESRATVVIEGTTFRSNQAETFGGAIRAEDADVSCTGCVFEHNSAALAGGAIYSVGGDLTLVDSSFDGHTTQSSGGAIYFDGQGSHTLSIDGSAFSDNESATGGALVTLDATLEIRGSSFTSNQVVDDGDGGVLHATTSTLLTLIDNDFCDTSSYKGTLYLLGAGNGSEVANNRFVRNTTFEGGGVYAVNPDGLDITNNAFVSNVATGEGPDLYINGYDGFSVVNNVHAWSQGLSTIRLYNTPFSEFDVTYNLFHVTSTTAQNVNGSAGNALIEDEPAFSSFDPSGSGCTYNLAPVKGSPLIDAGDPDVQDADGTKPSDVGAYGGPDAPDAP